MTASTLPEAWRRKRLTTAEQKVVELVITGLSSKEAAARLGKSALTVRNQLSDAMRLVTLSPIERMVAIHVVEERRIQGQAVGRGEGFSKAIALQAGPRPTA